MVETARSVLRRSNVSKGIGSHFHSESPGLRCVRSGPGGWLTGLVRES